MKKLLLSVGIVLLSFSAVLSQGGPDLFGYVWKDSNDPQGPTYDFVEITGSGSVLGTGTEVMGLGDDNAAAPLGLGFDFHYYWDDYNMIQIGTNGWMSFQTNVGNIAHCFPTIPFPGGNGDNLICPFMTDLNFAGTTNPGSIWYWTNNTDSFVVTYQTSPWWVNNVPDFIGSNTFQVIFSGVDSSITFQYKEMDPSAFNNGTCETDIVIGMENVTGDIGLNPSTEQVPGNEYAIKFYFPQEILFTAPDCAPIWASNSDNQGQFVPTNFDWCFKSKVGNVGNGDLTTEIAIEASLADVFGTPFSLWNDTLGALPANAGNTVYFTPTFEINDPGQYIFKVETDNPEDVNNSNNVAEVEIQAISWDENSCDTLELGYTSNFDPDGIAGFGIGEGLGIKIVPPAYPVTLNGVSAFAVLNAFDPANVSEFRIEVYDDNGVNGAPGTLLSSQVVPQGSYTPDQYVNTVLSSPVVVNDGGVYIGVILMGDSVFLGTETVNPISRRSYEILSGVWATYRSSTEEEVCIRGIFDFCGSEINVDTVCQGVYTQPELDPIGSFKSFPNPTSGITTIEWMTESSLPITLSLSNLYGQTITSKDFGMKNPGIHRFEYNTANLANGIYLVSLRSGGFSKSIKLVVAH